MTNNNTHKLLSQIIHNKHMDHKACGETFILESSVNSGIHANISFHCSQKYFPLALLFRYLAVLNYERQGCRSHRLSMTLNLSLKIHQQELISHICMFSLASLNVEVLLKEVHVFVKDVYPFM